MPIPIGVTCMDALMPRAQDAQERPPALGETHGRPDAPPFRPYRGSCMRDTHRGRSKRTPTRNRVHTPCISRARIHGITVRSRDNGENRAPPTRGLGRGPARPHGAALSNSPDDTAPPGTTPYARAGPERAPDRILDIRVVPREAVCRVCQRGAHRLPPHPEWHERSVPLAPMKSML